MTDGIVYAPNPTIFIENAGKKLGIAPLSAVEKMRVYKILPPGAEAQLLYLSMVFTACSVRTIDGAAVPWPSKPSHFEFVIERIGDSGVEAVQAALMPPKPAEGEEPALTTEMAAGNLLGGTSSSAAPI